MLGAMWPRGGVARGLIVVAAVAVVTAAGAALWWRDAMTYDVGVYRRYGEAMAAGEMPYRDFRLEYPPGALPVFVGPALVTSSEDAYRVVFGIGAACVEIATILVGLVLLGRIGAGVLHRAAYVAFVAGVAALPLGAVALTRFDFWPAFLLLVALALEIGGRSRFAALVLGLAIAAKIYPIVVAPLLLVHAWRRGGARETLVVAGVMAATIAVVFAPFAVLAPRRVASSLWEQLGRPLQIESLGSALVIALHRVAGVAAGSGYSHGSYNLTGSAASIATAVTSVVAVCVLCALWVRYAQLPTAPERLLVYAAAVVAAFVAFGKVLSPQFLIWLLPLVPLARGRRGLLASSLLAAAAALTTIWIPFRQNALVETFAPFPSWALLLRDIILVAVVLTLVPLKPRAATVKLRSRRLVSSEH